MIEILHHDILKINHRILFPIKIQIQKHFERPLSREKLES